MSREAGVMGEKRVWLGEKRPWVVGNGRERVGNGRDKSGPYFSGDKSLLWGGGEYGVFGDARRGGSCTLPLVGRYDDSSECSSMRATARVAPYAIPESVHVKGIYGRVGCCTMS